MKQVAVKKSVIGGKGVFAQKNFQKGEYILTNDDSHVVKDYSKLTKKQHEFDLDYFDGKIIFTQPPEKYINHSCEPNVYVKTVKGKRNVYAMKDISRGEEITADYAINGDNEGTFSCHCGAARCRKVYVGNFFKLSKKLQREYAPYLDTWFVKKYQQKICALK